MDSLIREQFFSRQGKATKHFFNSFRSFSPRDPQSKDLDQKAEIVPSKLLEQVIKERHQAKLNEKKTKNSSFFTSVGRDFSLEESDSPGAGHYSPSFSWVDGRVNQGPRYSKASRKQKQAKVFLPNCINNDFQCISKNPEPLGEVDKRINKTVLTIAEYEFKQKAFRNWTPIPEKPTYKIISPIKLALQKPREPFVKEDSGPNPHRFNYHPSQKEMLLKFKRPESVDFGKMSFRSEDPPHHSPGPYDKNHEFIMPKLVKNVPNFQKQLERKPILLEHMLKTPDSPDLKKINLAFSKQGNVKNTRKLPLMHTLTARDDSMYKVTEAYSLNSRRSPETGRGSLNNFY